MSSNIFIANLIGLQNLEGMTDAQFAAKLGIHGKSWNRIKKGKVKGGGKFMKGVLNVYPGLKEELTAYLKG